MTNRIRVDVPLILVSDGVTTTWSLSIDSDIYVGATPGIAESVSLHPTDAAYVTCALSGDKKSVIFTWVTVPPSNYLRPVTLFITTVV